MSMNRVKTETATGYVNHPPLQDESALSLRLMTWGYRLMMLGVMAA